MDPGVEQAGLASHLSPASATMLSTKPLAVLALLNVLLGALLLLSPALHPDYRAYYAAGLLARTQPNQIYNWKAQDAIETKLFGDKNYFTTFFHPPLELPLFAALSWPSYPVSLSLFRIIGLGLLALSAFLLAKTMRQAAWQVMLLTAAIYPTMLFLVLGQDSALLLLIVVLSFYLLRKDNDIFAGIALSLALFKPQLPLAIAFALLVSGRKRFAAAFTVSSAAITAASFAYLGRSRIHDLLEVMRLSQSRLRISMMPTIRGVVAKFGSDHLWIAALALVVLLAVFVPLWRRSSLEFVFATAICVASVAPLHVYAYDLVVLVIPLLILISRGNLDVRLLAILYSAPLFAVVQLLDLTSLSVVATAFLGFVCIRMRPGEPIQMREAST